MWWRARVSGSIRSGWRPPVWTHLALLVIVTLVPVAVFSAGLVVRFARQERAAVERGLIETARALALRLVAITGYGQPEDRRRAHEAGFEAPLTTPVDPSELLTVVATP